MFFTHCEPQQINNQIKEGPPSRILCVTSMDKLMKENGKQTQYSTFLPQGKHMPEGTHTYTQTQTHTQSHLRACACTKTHLLSFSFVRVDSPKLSCAYGRLWKSIPSKVSFCQPFAWQAPLPRSTLITSLVTLEIKGNTLTLASLSSFVRCCGHTRCTMRRRWGETQGYPLNVKTAQQYENLWLINWKLLSNLEACRT